MYYLVKGHCLEIKVSYDEKKPTDEGSFEWIIEADTPEVAKEIASMDLEENDIIDVVSEIGTDELLKRENAELQSRIENIYKSHMYGNLTVREYAKLMRELDYEHNPELQYKAIYRFNRTIRLANMLTRKHKLDSMPLGEFITKLNAVVDASPETFKATVESLIPDFWGSDPND